jgi:hypothetical protein
MRFSAVSSRSLIHTRYYDYKRLLFSINALLRHYRQSREGSPRDYSEM